MCLKGVSCVYLVLKNTAIGAKQTYGAFMVIGIIIAAFNLRPGMTSVGPLIGIIRDDVGLANWSAGLLTSLPRSEEHTSELQSRGHLVCRLLLEKKKKIC